MVAWNDQTNLNMRFIATGGILKNVLKPDEQVTQQEMLTPPLVKMKHQPNKNGLDLDFTPIMGVMFFRQRIRIFDLLFLQVVSSPL